MWCPKKRFDGEGTKTGEIQVFIWNDQPNHVTRACSLGFLPIIHDDWRWKWNIKKDKKRPNSSDTHPQKKEYFSNQVLFWHCLGGIQRSWTVQFRCFSKMSLLLVVRFICPPQSRRRSTSERKHTPSLFPKMNTKALAKETQNQSMEEGSSSLIIAFCSSRSFSSCVFPKHRHLRNHRDYLKAKNI